MIKKLNITLLFISIMSFTELHAQYDRILLSGNCNIEGSTILSNYMSETSKIIIGFENKTENDILFSKYPIIFLCGEVYLKLSEIEIQELKKAILNGSFLLIDNYKSDYTLSIFIKKLLPEYPEENNSIAQILESNPYRVNFDELQFDCKQVFIEENLRVLAMKEINILEGIISENDNYLKLGSSLIFNYLTGN